MKIDSNEFRHKMIRNYSTNNGNYYNDF